MTRARRKQPMDPPSGLKLRVWLDDDLIDRRAQEGWLHVQTAWEAIRLLERGRVVELSLDHDLGDDQRCGRGIDVVDFPAEQQIAHGRNLWPRDGIRIHSANPYGRDAMIRSIKAAAGRVMDVIETRSAASQPRLLFEPRQ